jgi:hypothetical protein
LRKVGEYGLRYTGVGVNRYQVIFGSAVVQSTVSIQQDRWYFVVGWYDGTNVCVQVDNGAVSSWDASAVSLPAATTNPLVALKIGSASGGFSGDELFMYQRALSADERTAIYTAGIRELLAPPAEDLAFDFSGGFDVIQSPVFVRETSGAIARYDGQNLALDMEVKSRTDLTYQWFFNGQSIAGETNALLYLPDLASAAAGEYVLEATNPGGSVYSLPATITIRDVPTLSGQPEINGAGMSLTVPASDESWVLLFSTNLIDWVEVLTVEPGEQDSTVVDGSITNYPAGYYRLRMK